MVSPDGRWFLVVSERGVLRDNSLESTIWIFDRHAVSVFVSGISGERPTPRAIATFSAISNTPVISDVHWLPDSTKIAFLAKRTGGYPQLYIADSAAGEVKALTLGNEYVSSFDIQQDTIAYTTLEDLDEAVPVKDDLTDVTGQSLWSLLWRNRRLEDRTEPLLLHIPNVLHVLKQGQQSSLSFTLAGKPLRLYYPVLSISPDEQSLVTVAALDTFPAKWAEYQPRYGYEEHKLDPGNKILFDKENDWRPSQVVIVNLKTGVASPLVNAPAGRSLFHTFGPTQMIWSSDSRCVLVSNTFLPLDSQKDSNDLLRPKAAAVVIADVRTRTFELIAYYPQPSGHSVPLKHVYSVRWDQDKNEVSLAYATQDNVPIFLDETFHRGHGAWTRVARSIPASPPSVELTIEQNLNQPPRLLGVIPCRSRPRVIWDPNPQLHNVALGNVTLYHWKDREGNPRTGILVIPPDYQPSKRYPLVLQTHGIEPGKFFADGKYTTGSGGRAMASKGIIVLQMDQPEPYIYTPKEGSFQTEGFRSAIEQLTKDGFVDPKRVGAIGFSFTVFHVLYAITHDPSLFSAVSITDGNDLSYWLYLTWTDEPAAQQMAEKANGGVKPFGREGLLKWAALAPGFNLDRVKTPILISCLEKGTLVTSWDIYGGLRTLGKPVDMLWLKSEDAPHVLVQPRHRFLSQQTAVDWFDFWLNYREDPDAGKTEQYARWRELRRSQEDERVKRELPRVPNASGEPHVN
jgi:dipeptidyl aminopeptidase/acylaminoacyl peptidase